MEMFTFRKSSSVICVDGRGIGVNSSSAEISENSPSLSVLFGIDVVEENVK